MKPRNWGIIGHGSIAKEFIADLPFADTEQAVTAVLGRNQESVNNFAAAHHIAGRFTSIHEFIEKGKPEMVYIATPHPLHYEEAVRCLQHKIPVLCEKPLCLNAQQAEALIQVSVQNNTFLMEGMWIRFLPFMQKVNELIKAGMLGDLLTVYASINYKAPEESDSRYFNPALGGGSLLDLGVYAVFLATWILGIPDTVKAIATLTTEGVDKLCNAVFKYNSGAHATIESSLVKNSHEPAVITGSQGSLSILHPWFEKSPGLELVLDSGEKFNYPFTWEGHGLHFEVSETLHCLEKGKIESELMPHNFSVALMKIMDEVRKQIGVRYEEFE